MMPNAPDRPKKVVIHRMILDGRRIKVCETAKAVDASTIEYILEMSVSIARIRVQAQTASRIKMFAISFNCLFIDIQQRFELIY